MIHEIKSRRRHAVLGEKENAVYTLDDIRTSERGSRRRRSHQGMGGVQGSPKSSQPRDDGTLGTVRRPRRQLLHAERQKRRLREIHRLRSMAEMPHREVTNRLPVFDDLGRVTSSSFFISIP